jgi:hypothetical protein
MWNARCGFLILALFGPTCVQRDRPHGATDAAPAKGSGETSEVGIPGNDIGPSNSGADAGAATPDGQVGSATPDGLVVSGADAGQPSLEGYWDLVSTYSEATGITTPAASGTGVVYFRGGVVVLYLDNGGSKTCGQSTYTLQGTTIVHAAGNVDALIVTSTTLRMTNLQPGGPFSKNPGDYSDFVRLATFSADGYGPCS